MSRLRPCLELNKVVTLSWAVASVCCLAPHGEAMPVGIDELETASSREAIRVSNDPAPGTLHCSEGGSEVIAIENDEWPTPLNVLGDSQAAHVAPIGAEDGAIAGPVVGEGPAEGRRVEAVAPREIANRELDVVDAVLACHGGLVCAAGVHGAVALPALGTQPRHHAVTDHRTQVVTLVGCQQVAVEEKSEGVLVRDLEEAVGTDEEVDVEGVDVVTQAAIGPPGGQDRVQDAQRGPVQGAQTVDALDERAVVDVLDRHQANELAVLQVVIVSELRQTPQRL